MLITENYKFFLNLYFKNTKNMLKSQKYVKDAKLVLVIEKYRHIDRQFFVMINFCTKYESDFQK